MFVVHPTRLTTLGLFGRDLENGLFVGSTVRHPPAVLLGLLRGIAQREAKIVGRLEQSGDSRSGNVAPADVLLVGREGLHAVPLDEGGLEVGIGARKVGVVAAVRK